MEIHHRHNKITTIYKNIVKMFGYRRYKTSGVLDDAEIIKTFEKKDHVQVVGKSASGQDVVATYFNTGNPDFTKSNQLRTFLKNFNNKIVLLITADKPTSYISAVMKDLSQNMDIEYILDSVFYIEVPKHYLVPKHEIITRAQFDSELKYHYTTPQFLQKIDVNDPVAIWLGGRVDDIFKITRFSENTGEAYAYRQCIRR